MSPSSPVTVRLDDDHLEALKEIARVTSFHNNKDFTHSDLIRDAVQKYLDRAKDNTFDIVVKDADAIAAIREEDPAAHEGVNVPLTRLEDTLNKMTGEDMLSHCGLSFNNPICRALKSRFKGAIERDSIARKVLMLDELPDGGVPNYERNFQTTIYQISRRGGVPDIIKEGDSFICDMFEIACAPSLKISQVYKFGWRYIVENAGKAAENVVREEDSNLLCAIEHSARDNNAVLTLVGMELENIDYAIDNITTDHFIAHNIIMSGTTYDILKAKHRSKGGDPCWRFKSVNVKTDTRSIYAGRCRDACIMLTPRAMDKIYLTNQRDETGVFVVPSFTDAQVFLTEEIKKLSIRFVYFVEIGMWLMSRSTAIIEFANPNDVIRPEENTSNS